MRAKRVIKRALDVEGPDLGDVVDEVRNTYYEVVLLEELINKAGYWSDFIGEQLEIAKNAIYEVDEDFRALYEEGRK